MPFNHFSEIDKTASIIAAIAGVWGAILSFSRRDCKNHNFCQKCLFFVFDMIVNVGITMLIYIGCIGYGFNELTSVAIAGFLGHQGTRSIYLMELIIAEKLGAKATFEEIKREGDDKL